MRDSADSTYLNTNHKTPNTIVGHSSWKRKKKKKRKKMRIRKRKKKRKKIRWGKSPPRFSPPTAVFRYPLSGALPRNAPKDRD
jgi:hypothetical protein